MSLKTALISVLAASLCICVINLLLALYINFLIIGVIFQTTTNIEELIRRGALDRSSINAILIADNAGYVIPIDENGTVEDTGLQVAGVNKFVTEYVLHPGLYHGLRAADILSALCLTCALINSVAFLLCISIRMHPRKAIHKPHN